MRYFLNTFILTMLLFTVTGAHAQEAFPVSNFSDLKSMGTAKITAVIDPYTLQVDDGRIIRLTGIEYPDYDLSAAGEFTLTAKKILEDILPGQTVEIFQTKRDDWGRTNRMGHELAHIALTNGKGGWIQGIMVRLGLARVRTAERNPEQAAPLYDMEALARKETLGLWERPAYGIHSPETITDAPDGFYIVEGTVESASLKQNRIYLNFGKDWKSDFTVSIAPENKRLFSKLGIDPLQWNGKTIRARGWVRQYNGAYMEVTHPQAIEEISPSHQ